MQGAPKKTSGRSPSWNAPLRATSSTLSVSTWCAVSKLHKTQMRHTKEFVVIALMRERFTSGRRSKQRTGRRACGTRFSIGIYFCRLRARSNPLDGGGFAQTWLGS